MTNVSPANAPPVEGDAATCSDTCQCAADAYPAPCSIPSPSGGHASSPAGGIGSSSGGAVMAAPLCPQPRRALRKRRVQNGLKYPSPCSPPTLPGGDASSLHEGIAFPPSTGGTEGADGPQDEMNYAGSTGPPRPAAVQRQGPWQVHKLPLEHVAHGRGCRSRARTNASVRCCPAEMRHLVGRRRRRPSARSRDAVMVWSAKLPWWDVSRSLNCFPGRLRRPWAQMTVPWMPWMQMTMSPTGSSSRPCLAMLIRRALTRPVVLEELKRKRVPQKDIDTILRLLASRTG